MIERPHAIWERVVITVLTALWVLVLAAAWLLLPRVLGYDAGWPWFAFGWAPFVLVGLIPAVVYGR